MRASARCISCIVAKQEKMIRDFSDENKKSEYMHQVLEILYKYGQSESSPQLAEKIDCLQRDFWGELNDYTEMKRKYNRLLLEKEEEIEKQIQKSMKECIKYVCAGNYIDFSAVENVNEHTFEQLLEKAGQEKISEEEYACFLQDLEKAERLVYLTDNCGEIVLDKLFIKCIKERYPKLQITVIVRGESVLNDATLVDAREVGLDELVPCIGNGNAAPGTVLEYLSEEARQALLAADVVLAKGQGNFESLYGEGMNPYYLFLCKCELFVQRFGLEQYASVFLKEERMRIGQTVEA
ncbi:ARMT1-like domain-containing protein [Roseburia hominis]